MKIICLPFFLLLLCISSYSQINTVPRSNDKVLVGKCMDGMEVHTLLEYEVSNEDTLYTLSLRNLQYNTSNDYQSITFSGSKRMLGQLYNTIKSVFSANRRKRKDLNLVLTLGEKLVVVSKTKILGVNNVIISLPKGYCYLTERQVDKVFGKS